MMRVMEGIKMDIEKHSMSLVGAEISAIEMAILLNKYQSRKRCPGNCLTCQDYSCPINPHYTGDKDDN